MQALILIDGKAGFHMEEKSGINRIEDEEEFAEETIEMPDEEPDESSPDAEPEEASSAKAQDDGKQQESEGEQEKSEKAAQGKPETSDEGSSGKSGPFRRKEKKDKRDELIDELKDRERRQMAEFDNFRKRTEKEKSQMFEMGAKSVIEKILPVIDNFERGLETIPDDEKGGAFADGMEKVYRQMMSIMDELGVKAIEAEGTEFDPNLHNAVMHVEDEELGENIVVQEFQKGYTYRDSVVRHSMVKVAN